MRFLNAGNGAPRRRPLPRKTRRLLRLGVVGGLAAAAVAGGALFWLSDWRAPAFAYLRDAVAREFAGAGLRVERIDLEGRERTSRRAVIEALAVTRGMPLLAVDLSAARARLERLPWVGAAGVRRAFPDALRVTLGERRPVAVWRRGKRIAVLDESGEVIRHVDPKRFPDLIVIAGDGARGHVADLLATLSADPELGGRVGAAVRVGGRRWNVEMDNGVHVWLPEAGARGAWSRLARLEREHRLLEQRLEAVDLRFPDRLIVRTLSGAPPRKPRVPARGGERT